MFPLGIVIFGLKIGFTLKNMVMKKIYSTFIIALLLIAYGCKNPEKALNKGQYDTAINYAAKKLRRKPSDPELLSIVEIAFNRAVENDKMRIDFLKKEGDPASFGAINAIYANLKNRQSVIRNLPVMPANITLENYDDAIIESKQKAAEYHYTRGCELLAKNDRYAARDAMGEFQKLKTYYPNYKDTDAKIKEAEFIGTNNVLFKMTNASQTIMPKQFEEELLKMPVNELNKQWVRYFLSEQEGYYYDYNVNLKLTDVLVSPEQVKERESQMYSKDIKDGWKYVYDSKGNVRKDSAGNDMKEDVFIRIQCKLIETEQYKSAIVRGILDYTNNRTGELIKSFPITSETVFLNISAKAIGDPRALPTQELKKTQSSIMPFPSDEALLIQSGEKLKNDTKTLLFNERELIK